jgi:AraC family transcriptional activator of pobA
MAQEASSAPSSFQSISARQLSLSAIFRPIRTPCFSVYLLEKGRGQVQVDYASHAYHGPILLCLSPYQRCVFSPKTVTSGWVIHFHANFFCIETHHHEVGCDGVLFNEVYEVPIVELSQANLADFSKLVGWMDSEMEGRGVAHTEVLVSCLKILLIKATRLKVQQQSSKGGTKAGRPDVLRKLREMLETGYQREHRPSEYARMVGVSSRTLANLVKRHFHKTPSELIRDRVMRHAKWQLLHTLKPVKEVAFEVGFDDEFYFSRLFKRSFGCSPLFFREHETALRGGSNLSM